MQSICPSEPPCQDFIAALYLSCDGVTLPDGYFYDPQRTITGTWGDDVRRRLRIAIGRCACNAGWGLKPGPAVAAAAALGALLLGAVM